MAAAMVVADYIIEKANRLGKPINNFKLQRVMFFLNVQYLLQNKKSLIDATKFEKWSFGAVVRQVYRQYATFGSNEIKEIPKFEYIIEKNGEYKSNTYVFKDEDLDKDVRDFIDSNIEIFINRPTTELVSESHKDPQWRDKTDYFYNKYELIEYYSKHKFW